MNKLIKSILIAATLPTFHTCLSICDVGTKRGVPENEYWTGEIVVIVAIITFSLAITGFIAGRSSK